MKNSSKYTTSTINSISINPTSEYHFLRALIGQKKIIIHIHILAFTRTRADVGRFFPSFSELIQMKINLWKCFHLLGLY